MAVPALKEWAVVVRALLEGEQILDLRKGGLHEPGGHFEVRAERAWLYPTSEHQRADLIKPAYRRWLSDTTAHGQRLDVITIPGWIDVVATATISDAAQLEALDSRFVWTLGYAEQRLGWKARQPLTVLAVRAYQLDEPLEVGGRADHAGCSSWVDIAELPQDPASLAARPALTDESFAARLDLCAKALPGGFDV